MIEDERRFIGMKFANFKGDDPTLPIDEGGEWEHRINAERVGGGHAVLLADQQRVVEPDLSGVFDDIFAKIDGNADYFDTFSTTFGTNLTQ